MKYILRLFIILATLACTKEKVNQCDYEEKLFDYEVRVEDYYSEGPINEQMVVLRYCEVIPNTDILSPCDSIDFKTTNTQGTVDFSGSYLSGCGNLHELILLKGNGYPSLNPIKPQQNISTTVIRIKPLISTELRLESSLEIDSIRIWTSAEDYAGHYFTLNFKDSIHTPIQTIPDQMNYFLITAYGHDTVVGHRNTEFTPEYGEVNILNFEFK